MLALYLVKLARRIDPKIALNQNPSVIVDLLERALDILGSLDVIVGAAAKGQSRGQRQRRGHEPEGTKHKHSQRHIGS